MLRRRQHGSRDVLRAVLRAVLHAVLHAVLTVACCASAVMPLGMGAAFIPDTRAACRHYGAMAQQHCPSCRGNMQCSGALAAGALRRQACVVTARCNVALCRHGLQHVGRGQQRRRRLRQ